jgi:hypothetical protein
MKNEHYTTEVKNLINRAHGSGIGRANGTLNIEGAEYYIRIGPRVISENFFPTCFQIARIDTPQELQGKGIFDRFLENVRSVSCLPFYVELVHNKRLASALIRRGFGIVKKDTIGTCDFFRDHDYEKRSQHEDFKGKS